MAEPKSEPKPMDLVSRGDYGSSPLGTTIMLGLRSLDGFVLQRALQVLDPVPTLLARLNLSIPPPPPTGGPPTTISMLGQNPTPFQAVLWSMSIGSAMKQNVWLLALSNEKMTPTSAVFIGVYNSVCNALNNLAFSFASVNPTWSETCVYVSIPLFIGGILIETVSEYQRKNFKDDSRNKGKLYAGGLFGYARSINYFGYMLWRGAFALAAGGWGLGALVAGWQWFDFTQRAIPVMDEYCEKKYGVQWAELKRKVPYAFCPGVC